MVGVLGRQPGVCVTALVPRDQLNSSGEIGAASPMFGLAVKRLPFSRWAMERLWWGIHMPCAERWCPDADWVYSPVDAVIPTRRAKFAVTIHDIEAFETDLPWSDTPGQRRFRRRWKAKLPTIYRYSNLILTVSEFSKRRMVELLGWDPSRIAVVGNGIDERFYQAAQSTIASKPLVDVPYLAVIGGLTMRKGAVWTIRLAEELQRRGSKLKIAVAGKSETQFAQQAVALPNIVQLGFVQDAELPGFLKQAVALLFLSRYEGFGMPILEAMACQTPAIVSGFASLPEVAGEAGIIVDVENTAMIADLALQLMDDPVLRRGYSERGIKIAERATWQACVDRLRAAMSRV